MRIHDSTQALAWRAELARLDGLLLAWLRRLRERGRGPISDAAPGQVVEDGEAEGLLAELARAHRGDAPEAPRSVEERGDAATVELATLARATRTYELGRFERDVLALLLATEVDPRYGRVFAYLNDHAQQYRPTVGLVCGVLAPANPDAALAAFLPGSPLIANGLIAVDGDAPLPGRALRIEDSFWPRLLRLPLQWPAGLEIVNPELHALARLTLTSHVSTHVTRALTWLRDHPDTLVLVHGPPGTGREALATAMAADLGLPTLIASAGLLEVPAGPSLLARELRWHAAALLLRPGGEAARPDALAAIERTGQPIFCLSDGKSGPGWVTSSRRDRIDIGLEPLDVGGRTRVWSTLLPEARRGAGLDVGEMAARFRFGPGRIRAAIEQAQLRAQLAGEPSVSRAHLSEVCRALPSARLGALAQKLPLPFSREDLVTSAETQRELDLALSWARHSHLVLHEWQVGEKLFAGRGLTCLFSGPPGTGKTMAAQVIARQTGLDLYRIDLSQVVSKYIGETEKNLATLFDEAREGNVILFFDEADALFGKRTEVKDAHDRYANVETGFLLQRLEMHEGISILATNLRRNLDEAFLRRLHVIAEFALPGAEERLRIWRGHLPAALIHGAELDLALLAERVVASGGEIRNAVVTAAFLAAGEGVRLGMRHLILGAWRELQKSGRMLDANAFGPWSAEIVRFFGKRSRG